MDIMALGAIGELVGGVAVIATLAYLAVQVRQSNQLAKAQSSHAIMTDFVDALFQLKDPEFATTVRRGLMDFAGLPKAEQVGVNAWMSAHAIIATTASQLANDKMLDRETGAAFESLFRSMVHAPGGAEWWRETRPAMTPEFVERLDALEQRHGPARPLTELFSWYAPEPTEGA